MESIKNTSFLERIFEKSLQAIFICDLNGNILEGNEKFQLQMSLDDNSLKSKNINDLVKSSDVEKFRTAWQQTLEKGEWEGNFTLVNYDNSISFSVNKTFHAEDKVICFCNDPLPKEKNAAEYTELYERYKLATEAGGIGVWEWSLGTEIIINDAMKDIYEIKSETDEINVEIINEKILAEDLKSYNESFEKLLNQRGQISFTHRIQVSSGIKYIKSLSKVLVVDNDILKVYGINIDITEQIRNQESILIAKRKAEESETLKNAFLHNISHELRTPLNGIIGFSNLLQEDGLSDEEKNEYIGLIKLSSNSLIDTINNIIDISKLETGQFEIKFSKFSCKSLLEDIYSLQKANFTRKNLKFNYILDEDIYINSDQTIVSKIFNHLISNALKFTNEGKTDIGFEIGDDTCRFFVKDTGIGIHENKKEAIFKRFIQGENHLSRSYEGSGLGLAISKELLELIGGSIYFDSAIGKGTNFYFEIPINKKSDKDEKSMDYINPEKIKVLIAEDDDASYTLLRILLSKMNFEIDRSFNGLETVEKVKNGDYGLVLMDMKMPKMSGYEATQKIREFNQDIKIIAATADALDRDKTKAMESGCDDHLSKPIDTVLLKKVLNKVILNHE